MSSESMRRAGYRNVTMWIGERDYRRLSEMAEKAAVAPGAMARGIICSVLDDEALSDGKKPIERSLDEIIRRVLVLRGAGLNAREVVHWTKLSEETINRVIAAWQDELMGVA